MTDDETIRHFGLLFQGNTAAVGTEEGGCQRLHGDNLDIHLHIEAHLTGEPREQAAS